MKLFYAFIVMLTLSLGFSAQAMAHDMQKASSHDISAVHQTQHMTVGHAGCPTKGKMVHDGVCCSVSACAACCANLSESFRHDSAYADSSLIVAFVTLAPPSVSLSGPQKPPRIS